MLWLLGCISFCFKSKKNSKMISLDVEKKRVLLQMAIYKAENKCVFVLAPDCQKIQF